MHLQIPLMPRCLPNFLFPTPTPVRLSGSEIPAYEGPWDIVSIFCFSILVILLNQWQLASRGRLRKGSGFQITFWTIPHRVIGRGGHGGRGYPTTESYHFKPTVSDFIDFGNVETQKIVF